MAEESRRREAFVTDSIRTYRSRARRAYPGRANCIFHVHYNPPGEPGSDCSNSSGANRRDSRRPQTFTPRRRPRKRTLGVYRARSTADRRRLCLLPEENRLDVNLISKSCLPPPAGPLPRCLHRSKSLWVHRFRFLEARGRRPRSFFDSAFIKHR